MVPLITIAIPTFNRLKYLQESTASALQQTYPNIEIIIGDDGNSAELGTWASALSKSDPRVRYQKNPKNLGIAGNWNAIIRAAKGKFINIIGDDDRLTPEFVEELYDPGQSDIDVFFSNHYLIDSNGKRLEQESKNHTAQYQRDQIPAGPIQNPEYWIWQNALPLCASLVRIERLLEFPFREDLNTPEIEFFLRLEQHQGTFFFNPAYLMEYRTHSGSASASGLWSENLVKYLEPLPVGKKTEVKKRAFMEPLLLDAVGRLISQRKPDAARQLMKSRYYPSNRSAKRSAQKLAVHLPGSLGALLYKTIQRLN